jgi:molybdenum cofactor biosynthesis enzyme MoaA
MSYRKTHKGIIPVSDFKHIARVLFPKALQVYIGCGAEPTMHRNFVELVLLAKQYQVPDIGVVTNGQLLTPAQLKIMIDAGLNEITLSCHGVTQTSYEYFMTNSKFDRFLSTLQAVNDIKKESNSNYPELRINYTVNNKNLSELRDFFTVFEKYHISTLQVRPVLNIGGEYSHAISQEQIPEYNNIIAQLKNKCKQNEVRLLANTSDINYQKKNTNKKVTEAVYCYIGPQTNSTLDFEWSAINFKAFRKKTKWRKNTFSLLFKDKKSSINKAAGNFDVFE